MKSVEKYNYESIFNKLCERYEALYIIDTEENLAIKIKSSQDLKSIHNPKQTTFNWDEISNTFVEKLVSNDFKDSTRYFYNRENLQKMFTTSEEKKEFVHQLFSGKWNKMILQPLEFNKGTTKRVLLTIIDFTSSKIQTAKILDSAQISLNKYSRLFIDAVSDIYEEIIRFNYIAGTASTISVSNDKIIEVPYLNWNTLYKKIFTGIHPEDKDIVSKSSSMDTILKMKYNDKLSYTYRSNRNNPNEYRWFTTTIKITSEVGDAIVFTQDITNHIQERKYLLDKSEHDSLTDLFNRNKLQQMMETEYKNLKSCGVLFFDINNLKPTNDQYGHEKGDELLQRVANSIHSITGRNIHAYRYGGDEFIVVAPNIEKEALSILVSLWKLRLDNIVAENDIPCSVAVGSAWKDNSESLIEIKDLISIADKRMYEQKQKMKSL